MLPHRARATYPMCAPGSEAKNHGADCAEVHMSRKSLKGQSDNAGAIQQIRMARNQTSSPNKTSSLTNLHSGATKGMGVAARRTSSSNPCVGSKGAKGTLPGLGQDSCGAAGSVDVGYCCKLKCTIFGLQCFQQFKKVVAQNSVG